MFRVNLLWRERSAHWKSRSNGRSASLGQPQFYLRLFRFLAIATVVSTTLWFNSEAHRVRAAENAELADKRLRQTIKQNRDTQTAINDLMDRITGTPEIAQPKMRKYRDELSQGIVNIYSVLRSNQPTDEELIEEYAKQAQHLSRALLQLGDYRAAQPLVDDLIQLTEGKEGLQHYYLMSIKRMSMIKFELGDYDDSRENQLQCLSVAKKLLEEKRFELLPHILDCLNAFAQNSLAAKQLNHAKTWNDEAIDQIQNVMLLKPELMATASKAWFDAYLQRSAIARELNELSHGGRISGSRFEDR